LRIALAGGAAGRKSLAFGDTLKLSSNTRRHRVCIAGSGTRFLSGISYYTLHLANQLAESHDVSVVLMRRLLPRFLYPGHKRVGKPLTELVYAPSISVFDGVDWYWLPSIFRALAFLIGAKPDVMVFQWWTGTVLHSYLALALMARLLGSRIIIEFHEVLDTAELKMPFARAYVGLLVPWLIRFTDGFVAHSEYDCAQLGQKYRLGTLPHVVFPHGPYDHHQGGGGEPAIRPAPPTCLNVLFFGVIRPFKGLEDLITAFNAIPQDEIGGYWLTIVGEVWEGWTLPGELIAQSPYRDHITLVDRYVTDEELTGYLAGADVVALPYHRSSASGPLHTTMSCGLPVIVTHVGGLTEAAASYEGAVLVPPKDPDALRDAIVRASALRGQRFTDPHSWATTAERYDHLFDLLNLGQKT
jgi:glycosyltransferase involved in cell wall biosynthesis